MTDSDSTTSDGWIERLKSGSNAALAEFYTQNYRKLLRIAELRIGDRLATRVDASDVLQESFIEAQKKLEFYLQDPKVSPFIWLRGLLFDQLSRVQRMHLGAERRSLKKSVGLPDHSSGAFLGKLIDSISPSKNVMKMELRTFVRNAIDHLPETDREVLVLRHFEGLSNNEVAEVLGINASTATMRYGRALMKLREEIDREQSNWM